MEKRSHKSTHASNSQRSGSLMTIDTTIAQNAYAPQLQRKSISHTQQQLRRRSVYTSEPIMSPDELTSKIADNFQQFSSMLNQLQNPLPQSPARSRPTTPLPNRLSRPSSIDSKHRKRLSLKVDDWNNNNNNNNNNKNATWLLSPISMVSPPPPPPPATTTLNGTAKDIPTPKKKMNTRATQDKPLVTKFLRAASNGDTDMIEDLVQQCRHLVDDADRDDGTTALMYAACFGQLSTVKSLLDAGATIDEQDHYGWTALIWATVNHHDSVAALLISHGALQETKSIYGTMAFDLVRDEDYLVMTSLLDSTCSRRHCLTMDRMEKRKKSKQLLKASRRQSTPVITATTTASRNSRNRNSFQHSGGMDAYTHFMTTESEHQRRLTQRHELFYDALLTLKKNGSGAWTNMDDMDAGADDEEEDGMDDDRQIVENYNATHQPFSWDSCLADQMFVFSMDDLDTILDVALDTKAIPTNNNNNKDDILWLPANLLFLCARFAYYYSDRGALAQFLEVAISRLVKVSKQCTKDVPLLQYWMTNIYQFLVYLRHDTGLEGNTAHQQRQLADLMAELYLLLIRGYERQLDKMIASSLLDYEPIEGMGPVDFEDANDWSTFFQRRGSIRASMDSLNGGGGAVLDAGRNESVGPHAITATLERIQIVMTTVYELPGYMVKHSMAQCLHYVLCEGFNQILDSRTYLCRTKAQHIRLNLSTLEEWAHQMELVDNNTHCMVGLDRLAQLLQFLQCVSELDDVDAFRDTCRGLTLLDSVQIKRCVVKYRYETHEAHLPAYVEEWVVQRAQQQKQKQSTLDRNAHIHQLKDFLLKDSHDINKKQHDEVDEPCMDLLSVDSLWILPFYQGVNSGTPSSSLPTHKMNGSWNQQDALSEPMYLEIKQKAERDKKNSIRIPSLPYKFIDKLDKKLYK